MKKKFMIGATAIALALSLTTNSCIGSFALSNKLLSWNQNIGSKFENALVFFAFWILPVYEVSMLADVLVLNTIEFWSGTSPVAYQKQVVKGADSDYLVEGDAKGYNVTRMADGSVTRFNFDVDEQTWSVVGQSGEEYPLLIFVDDTHVKVPMPNGEWQVVERTQEGLYAYQAAVILDGSMALK